MSINRFLQFSRRLRHLLVGAVTLSVITLVLGIVQSEYSQVQHATESDAGGWGAEALNDRAGNHDISFSFISPANACGLGASSCFKCHNGNRAVAPGMDGESDPWHTDHRSVNHSCTGCHKGNPRLMKEALAHTKMLANPLTDLEQACASCHRNDDMSELVKVYKAKSGGN